MAASTGPILAAGGITWVNNVLLGDKPEDLFTASARVGIGTGLAVMVLYLIEKPAPELGTAFAWAALVTVLFIRIPKGSNNPTPLERALSLV